MLSRQKKYGLLMICAVQNRRFSYRCVSRTLMLHMDAVRSKHRRVVFTAQDILSAQQIPAS
jgi:hypothetical protein